jgi:HAMP domain-containing protein
VAIVTHGRDGVLHVASTLAPGERHSLVARARPAASGAADYLSFARRLDANGDAVELILLRPLPEVLAPYRELRDDMLLIDGIALFVAALVGAVLGRSATHPIGELMRAARRIEQGQYETAVHVSGGNEFKRLAATFNAMQSNIAAREADITHQAYHDPLTQLPNRALVVRGLEGLVNGVGREASAALVLIELRNLRDINASLGHQVGDDVLREAARRLQQNVAAADTLARLGLLLRACAAVCRAAGRGDPHRLSPRRRELGCARRLRRVPVPGARAQRQRAAAARAGGTR